MRKSLVLGALLAVPALAAAALAPLSLQPGSRVWVEGTSTARAWRCESTRAVGSAAAATTELAQLANVSSASVTVPVGTLDCRNNTMNGHMRTALKATEAPELRFRATSVSVTPTERPALTASGVGAENTSRLATVDTLLLGEKSTRSPTRIVPASTRPATMRRSSPRAFHL